MNQEYKLLYSGDRLEDQKMRDELSGDIGMLNGVKSVEILEVHSIPEVDTPYAVVDIVLDERMDGLEDLLDRGLKTITYIERIESQ